MFTVIIACFHFLFLISIILLSHKPGTVKGEPIVELNKAELAGRILSDIIAFPASFIERKMIQEESLRKLYETIGFILYPLNSLLWGFIISIIYLHFTRKRNHN